MTDAQQLIRAQAQLVDILLLSKRSGLSEEDALNMWIDSGAAEIWNEQWSIKKWTQL